MSGLDWFPTLVAAAGDPKIVDELRQGKQLGDSSYKVYLDGYNQMDLITGKGPSRRHEVLYFAEDKLGAVRIDDYKYRFIDQPSGWLGGTVQLDWPVITNLRLDPYERAGMPSGAQGAMGYGMDFFAHEFWRFVFVQQEIEKLAQTFIDFKTLLSISISFPVTRLLAFIPPVMFRRDILIFISPCMFLSLIFATPKRILSLFL